MSAGDCPKVEELPKIEGSLKEELVKQHELKKTEVAEKNVLPSAEDLKAEKTHEGILKGVEGFTPDKLNAVKTREAASPLDVAKSELAHQKTGEQLKDFDKANLKHAETQEKNPLPDHDNIKAEADHNKFKEGIEGFSKDNLKTAETIEKNTLPTKEIIEQEKSA